MPESSFSPEEVAYQKSLDFLYEFVDYSLTRQSLFSPDEFDLGRMVAFLDLLGNPHQQYKIIHVAGTKGKGSVSALIASVLSCAGHQTGFYTSPHLQDYAERVQINGYSIPHSELSALVEELKPHIKEVERLTTFEITTALAFLYFARHKVDVAVIEVGLGGKLDATNVVLPLVSVITSISYDHTHILGDSLSKIAAEKGGIIKLNCPVILAPQKDEARWVIKNIAFECNAPIFQVGVDHLFAPVSHTLDGQSFIVWSAKDQEKVNQYIETGGAQNWEPLRLDIPLLGFHQIVNGATAYTTLQIIRQKGIDLDDEDIRNGFRDVFWPGRFEVLRRDPAFIVDSAHNQDSALRLRIAIEDYLPGKPVILLFGASEDKDISGMFAELLPRVQRVIATESVHPRALSADKLVESAHQYGCPAIAVVPVEAALDLALKLAGKEAVIVVAGSLFVAAAVRECWEGMGLPLRKFKAHP